MGFGQHPLIRTVPNLLTLSRIFVIPLVVALFFVTEPWARWANLGLFTAAGITDWLDGYLARRMGMESAVGKFLDPIADKLLVVATLFMLAATDGLPLLSVLPAVAILMREVLISGLREFLAGITIALPVTRLAKWKTTVQFVALALLVVGDEAAPGAGQAGAVSLWLAAVLTVVTGWDYLWRGLGVLWAPQSRGRPPVRPPPRIGLRRLLRGKRLGAR